MIRLQVVVLALVGFVRLCIAQASGWNLDAGQWNTTMCYWTAPRGMLTPNFPWRFDDFDKRIAAVIRDTVYIDGGYLWWQPGLKDGTYGIPMADGMKTYSQLHQSE